MIISFIITMITARYLGPTNYGVLSYGASFVTFFLSFVNLGLNSIIVNEFINNPQDEGKILGTSIFLRVISSGISIISIFILISILKPGKDIIIITTMLQSIVLIFHALSIFDYWFQSRLESKYVSIAKIVAYTIASLYKVILLINRCSVILFAIATVLDYFIICIMLFIFYKKKKGQSLMVDLKLGKNLLKKSYHFIISSIMVVIYTQIDKIMIGSMMNETYVGYYAAALAIHSAYGFIPQAIINSARPTIYIAKKEDNNKYKKRLKQTYAVIFWSSILFSIIICLCSAFIIKILYGVAYIEATVPLMLLAFATPFAYIGTTHSIWLVSENLYNYNKKFLGIGVIINIVLNFILIPKIGIIGAALATLITEFFTNLIVPLLFKDLKKYMSNVYEGIILKFN